MGKAILWPQTGAVCGQREVKRQISNSASFPLSYVLYIRYYLVTQADFVQINYKPDPGRSAAVSLEWIDLFV